MLSEPAMGRLLACEYHNRERYENTKSGILAQSSAGNMDITLAFLFVDSTLKLFKASYTLKASLNQ